VSTKGGNFGVGPMWVSVLKRHQSMLDFSCQIDNNPFQQKNDCRALTTTYAVSLHWKIAGANDLSNRQEWKFVWMKACQLTMHKDTIAELGPCWPRVKYVLNE
jgi:hypothetical protein